MKKYFSSLFEQYPFAVTFGVFFSIILLLFFITKQYSSRITRATAQQESISYFERKTGHKMNPEEIYVYESIRNLRGDGYSIWIYNLSNAEAAYFMKPDSLLFSKYPLVGEHRTHWNHQKWKRGPFDEKDGKYLKLALIVGRPNDPEAVNHENNWTDRIRSILNNKNCLYAFSFTNHDPTENPRDVDFYIISPDDNVLIVINHNT